MDSRFSNPLSPSANRTKIVVTLGPATWEAATIRRLAEAGADVFRINFSHGDHERHGLTIDAVRSVAAEIRRPLAVLADLCGPKLRIGDVHDDGVAVEADDTITLTSEHADGTSKVFQVSFKGLHTVAQPGHVILLDDGLIRLEVVAIHGTRVHCRVENAGVIRPRKGVNLPDTTLPVPAFTEKDRNDLRFALEHDVDVVAMSFVRKPEDFDEVFAEMDLAGKWRPVFAKIEKSEAVDNLAAILDRADGAMVARGDLGIEIPMERVPTIQKRLIEMCNDRAKPVITATQMLDSMIRNPRPTRAEVTDVYNAILDGTDGVMLSGETAVGEYPVETVATMNRIAGEAEAVLRERRELDAFRIRRGQDSTSLVVSHAAVAIAEGLNLDAIVTPTWSGATARRVARYRPAVPIFACSPKAEVVNALSLVWGVEPATTEHVAVEDVHLSEADALLRAAIHCGLERGILRPGMKVVVIGGVPLGQSNQTNFLRVVEVEG